jgi:ABC-2 type transport system permease protein
LAPLGGAWWPLEITPQFMQIIGHISPIAWAMDGFRSLIFYGGTLTDVLLPVAVLLGASLVFLVIGARYFRYE